MPNREPSGGERSAFELIATARAERFTGQIELEVRDLKRSLSFVDGELYLPVAHPHSQRWRELLGDTRASESAKATGAMLEQLADSLGGSARQVSRSPGSSRLPADRVGPLPTAKLLRVAAARDPRASAGLVRRFGERRLVAELLPASGSHAWSQEELWVLERLRQPTSLGELTRDCPMPKEALERAVAGLAAVGQVRAEHAAAAPVGEDDLRELAAGLGERVAASLIEQPLEIELDDFRHRITALLANAGGLDHYELLGIDADASADETHHAFEELARLVHPLNARRFGLAEMAEPLRFLLERATEAYRVLTDPSLRLAYRATLELVPSVARDLDPVERKRELREMARRSFDRAIAEETNGDYQSALVLLEQVVQLEPTAEHWAALGRLQARNRAWTARAIASYRSALALDATSGTLRFTLGELYERAGDVAKALELYEIAAQGATPHAGALAALDRLKEARLRAEGKSSGPRRLASIFRRS